MLVNESKVIPSKLHGNRGNRTESNVWYLHNGFTNHMTNFKSKFVELSEGITKIVKFGDGLKMNIEGKDSSHSYAKTEMYTLFVRYITSLVYATIFSVLVN